MNDLQLFADVYDELGRLGDRLKKSAEEQSDAIQDMRDTIEKGIDQMQIGAENE